MNSEELEKVLAKLPVARLHRLARGRIFRHFRLGKRRLIEALVRYSAKDQTGLESDLQVLLQEPYQSQRDHSQTQPRQVTRPPRGKAGAPGVHRKEPEPSEPATDLHTLLAGMGVPGPQPFVPDEWQEHALTSLAETDVVVSVPTGSGKTYVAVEATRRAIDADRTVIYTSPLKALSNTKYTEFSRIFGPEQVGILTGDRKDNPQAPLLIMTTEILRNLLYDAASGEIDVRLDTLGLVILDESQFLADPERGVVWEETIIFCPTQARLLLLSASIGNPQDVAEWLTSIRPTPCQLIRHNRRSVPLRAAYLHPSGKLTPLFRAVGIPQRHGAHLHPETRRLFQQYEEDTLGPRGSRMR